MKKYSFQMTKEEVSELYFRAMWEYLRIHSVKWLLLSAVLTLQSIFFPWTAALATGILFLLIVVAIAIWSNSRMKKQLCGKTRTMEVEAGMLKPGVEGELYCEIPCGNITEFRMTRHLLMLGLRQASKVIAWYPVPLRVFADEQERDSFLESVRNPQMQACEKTTDPDMGEHGEIAATDFGVQAAERSEQEYFRVSFQVGEEEWVRMMAAAAEIIQAGTLGKQRNQFVRIVLVAVASAFSCGNALFSHSAAVFFHIMSLVGMLVFFSLLRNMLENPERNIRIQLRKGMVQNNVLGVWEISVTDMGIRQSVSGENSALIPWESLLCAVETDDKLFFYQKDKRHFSAIPKSGLESREQIESLKGMCREKHVEVLAGKRKKYVPNGLISLLMVIVVMGYLWLVYGDFKEEKENFLLPNAFGYVIINNAEAIG